MNPIKSFLCIGIFVIVLGVLITAVKADESSRIVCRDLRQVSHTNCAMVTKTTVAKAKAPTPIPTQTKKPKTSLPAKAEHAIPAPSDTKAATVQGTTALDAVRTERLVLANFIETD